MVRLPIICRISSALRLQKVCEPLGQDNYRLERVVKDLLSYFFFKNKHINIKLLFLTTV